MLLHVIFFYHSCDGFPVSPFAFAPSRRARRKGTDANEMTETWNSARDILMFVEHQEQDPVLR
jgi:hypothetical protein